MELESSVPCLICNNDLNTTNCVPIFDESVIGDSGKSLVNIMSTVLQAEVNEENVHSFFICKACFKLFKEFILLESRMTTIREKMINSYKKTVEQLSQVEEIITSDHDYIDQLNSSMDIEENKIEEDFEKLSETNEKLTGSNSDDDTDVYSQFEEIDLISNNELEKNTTENLNSTTVVEKLKKNIKNEQSGMKKMKKNGIQEEATSDSIVEQTDSSYRCIICANDGIDFNGDDKQIIIHMKTKHDLRLYVCDVCGKDYRKRTDLSAHLDEHVAAEEGDFQCEVCNRIFANLRLFRIHKRIHYPQSKSWTCETCGKRYSSKSLLEEHVNTHLGLRPYVCEHCGKSFTSKYSFKAHLKIHEDRPRPFECLQCNKTFLSIQNLNQHERTHLGVKEFMCQHCGKTFGSAHNLEVHNIVHTGYKPYVCKVCNKAFARKAEIRDHERIHTGEKPYKCDLCDAHFSQRSNLQSHKRATHFNDKRYKCNDCGKGFKRRRLLDYHIKSAHTGERPYKCKTCSATFVYPEHYKKHLRIHTGEKPYLCEVCGKAFNSRDNRNAHRYIHSEKKPYECLTCGLGFMRKPLLIAHMNSSGHLSDTIVINQPKLSTEDGSNDVNESSVQLLIDDNDQNQMENTELYVTEIKNHVIIEGDGDAQTVLNIPDEELHLDVDNPIEVEEEVIEEGGGGGEEEEECKSDNIQDEEIYTYENQDGETIVVPTTDIIDKSKVRLVQIKIPSDNEEVEVEWNIE